METDSGKIHGSDISPPSDGLPWAITVKPFTDAILEQLYRWATVNEAVNALDVRALFGMTKQQFQRLTSDRKFPPVEPMPGGRFIAPQLLLDFCLGHNRLARGLPMSGVAKLLGCTVTRAMQLSELPGFPAVIGRWKGADRRDLDEMIAWQRARLGGAKLPPKADAKIADMQKKSRAPNGGDGKKPE